MSTRTGIGRPVSGPRAPRQRYAGGTDGIIRTKRMNCADTFGVVWYKTSRCVTRMDLTVGEDTTRSGKNVW